MLSVHIFNVGQGDSILVEFPDGKWGVVDCNADPNNAPTALRYLQGRSVQRLAFVCLTHPHADHYSGLPAILEHYRGKIDEFWTFRLDSAHWRRFLEIQQNTATTTSKRKQFEDLRLIFEKEMKPKLKQGNLRFLEANHSLPNYGGVSIDCIAPHPREVGGYMSSLARWHTNPDEYRADENKLSAVLRLKYGTSTVVLGSDARSGSWIDILREFRKRSESLFSNLVKVSHHGSIEGFYDPAWKELSKPHVTHGAISAGAGYGHPHREVIYALHKLEVRLHCTNYAPHCLQSEKLDLSKFEGIDPSLKLQLFMLDQSTNAKQIPCNGDLHFSVDAAGTVSSAHQYAAFCPFHIAAA